jgi:DNA recombination protein RmuC
MEIIIGILLGIVLIAWLLTFKRLQILKKDLTHWHEKEKAWTLASQEIQLQRVKAEEQLLSSRQAYAHLQQQWQDSQLRWQTELKAERDLVLQAERSLASAQQKLQAQEDRMQSQQRELEQWRKQMQSDFQLMANQILDEKTKKFTDVNAQHLDQILSPLQEKIKLFEEKVEKTYQQESAERHTLKGVVEQLMLQSKSIQDEANSLSRALRGDAKKQGNWGEVILERVLERSGLRKDQEYRLQASLMDEEGKRLQPDALIYLPDEKHLVVDAKVSLVAYERWVNAETDEDRDLFAKQHIQSVENHVKSLSAKNYQALYQIDSPDFVLLFMPIESAFSMSITAKAELFSDAWDRRVVLVSPSTLLATLRTIASVWKQERQTRNVLDIAKEAGALYDKFVGFVTDMNKVGEQLDRAKDAHESARKKLSTGSGNLLRRVENLKKLGAKANKQLDNNLLDGSETDDSGDV